MKAVAAPCIGCGFRCYMSNCHPVFRGRPMKLVSHSNTQLQPTNLVEVEQLLNNADTNDSIEPLVRLIADMIDTAIKGDALWMSIGLTSRRDAICITVHGPAGKEALYGARLTEVAAKCQDLL